MARPDQAPPATPDDASEHAFAIIGDRFFDAMTGFRRSVARQSLREQVDHIGATVLTATQTEALLVLNRQDAWQVQEFADAVGIDISTATRTLDPLVDLRLVSRRVDPANRRRKIVQATARGRREGAAILERRRRMMRAHLGQMSPGHRTMFVELLEEYVAIVESIGATGATGATGASGTSGRRGPSADPSR